MCWGTDYGGRGGGSGLRAMPNGQGELGTGCRGAGMSGELYRRQLGMKPFNLGISQCWFMAQCGLSSAGEA